MSKNRRYIKFSQAVNEAIDIAMDIDKNVICYGLGVTDPKGVFGTTVGLDDKYGKERVFDMPTSENAMTGIAVGAALNGKKVLMTHQRLDFFLLALDQLVNSAAKWHYMFGSQKSVPITIRLIVGRGWGQGPTHSQNLQAWFGHMPGLKVVMPTNAYNAKGLLISSILDPNPVVFLEHRWLHNSTSLVPIKKYFSKLGKAELLNEGKDITIVSMSYLTAEAIQSSKILESYNINAEVIDLISIRPIDWETIYNSVNKTNRIIVLDTGVETISVSSEIITRISMKFHNKLKTSPMRLAMPDVPVPTSFALTKDFYPSIEKIVNLVLSSFNSKIKYKDPSKPDFHDIPGDWFSGPF